jgi:hypothetical protein
MATQNTLTIINYFAGGMHVYVPRDDWWNCCDWPLWGDTVGDIAPHGGSRDLPYCRKDGHGCNGRQGQFTLVIAVEGRSFSLRLDFDSNGVMTTDLIAPDASNKLPDWARATMAQTAGSNTYTLTLGPTS